MKRDLELKLQEKCPNLYRDLYVEGTSMSWGLLVEDGWYQLIEDLSLKLEESIVNLPADSSFKNIRASYIKEKFGGLRYHLTEYNEGMRKLITEAEHKSFSICECCGIVGKRRNSSWIKTLCDTCY